MRGGGAFASKKLLAAFAVLAMVVCAFVMVAPAAEADTSTTLDYTISEKDGKTYISGPGSDGTTKTIEYSKFIQDTATKDKKNNDIYLPVLISSSQANGKTINVTMTGGNLNYGLIVIAGDSGADKPANVNFTMTGGTANGIWFAYHAFPSCSNFKTFYNSTNVDATAAVFDNPMSIAGNVTVKIGGDAYVSKTLQPTFSHAKMTSYSLTVKDNAKVDLLYTMGSNGDEGNVNINVQGGHVGYITAQRAKASSLTYAITGGTIDYLTIGADTEGGNNESLGSMQTSYITGNVTVNIETKATIVNPIVLGGGVLSMPTKVATGTIPAGDTMSGAFTVDAPGRTIQMSLYHMNDEGKAALLYGYTVDGQKVTYSPVKATSTSGKDDGMSTVWGVDSGKNYITSAKNIVLTNGSLYIPGNASFTGSDDGVVFGNKGASIVLGSESSITTKVAYGNDSATLSAIKAVNGTLTISAGSVEISGIMDASTANSKIESAAGQKVILKNLTITGGSLSLSNVTIDGKVTVKEGATITATSNVIISSNGNLIVAGTVAGTGLTNNGTIQLINENAKIPSTIGGTGSVDTSSIASEGTISGDWKTVTTYTSNQTITLTGDTVLKSGSQIIVMGKMIIPEGVTLTIEDGAQLVIYSSTGVLENNGTIVIQSKTGKINSFTDGTLGADTTRTETGGLINLFAEIINDGTISLDYSDSSSTSSAFAEYPQFNQKGRLTNNGDIVVGSESFMSINGKTVNSTDATITILGKVVSYNSNVIENAGVVTINGTISAVSGATALAITNTSADASVDIVSASAIDGDIAKIVIDTDVEAARGTTYNNYSSITISIVQNYAVKGLKVAVDVVKDESITGSKVYDVFVVLEGSVAYDTESTTKYDSADAPVVITAVSKVKVDAALALGVGVQMKVGTTAAGALFVNGTMSAVTGKVNNSDGNNYGMIVIATNSSVTVLGKLTTSATLGTTGVNAAYYKIDKTATSDESFVYTTLDQAVADGAKKIDIYGTTEVSVNVDVPSGTTVTIDSNAVLTITEDSKVSFVSGAALKNSSTIKVEGTLYIEVVKTALKSEGTINSQVVIKGEADRTYTTLANAISMAAEGSTIELSGEVVLTSDLTIPEGIKVDTKGNKITVSANVTLTVDGELFLDESQLVLNLTESEIQENGKIVNNGTVSATDYVYSVVKLGTDAYTIPGAYFSITEKATATYYVQPVAKAAANIAKADSLKLEIRSNETDGITIGDVSFTGTADDAATVVVMTKLTASSITLDLASITFDGARAFTGTITNGTGTVAIAGTAADEFAVTSSTSKDVKTLAVSGTFTDDGDDDKFVVTGDVTFKTANISEMTVDGNVKITGSRSSNTVLAVHCIVINGVVDVQNYATLRISESAEVFGTLTAATMTDAGDTAGVVYVPYIYVGITEEDSTGAAATVSGKIIVSGYAIVADGSAVPESITDTEKVTAYLIDGKAYVTVYDFATAGTEIGVVEADIENAAFDGWYADAETKEDVGGEKVGAYETVNAIIDYNIYNVVIITDSAVDNLYLDGNLMVSGVVDNGYVSTKEFAAGQHTVTYALKNGYTGTGVLKILDSSTNPEGTITVNGTSFTVSGDSSVFTLQLTGFTASGYTPVTPVTPSEDKDDGLSLTDILLIVLVVLIVIMAVIVAMRLMRS